MVESPWMAGGRPMMVVANLAATALLIASGLAHGRLTDRWGASTAMVEAIARLDRVPRSIGDWRGQDLAMDRRQIERAEIRGYLSRSYRNARDGREVSILLVCGRPGPIAVHTPDVCYKGAGYEVESEPIAEPIGTAVAHPARFLKARFGKPGVAAPESLEISWAWKARDMWEVPANPRVAFATSPYLFKLYAITRREQAASPTSPGGNGGDWASAGAILEAIDGALAGREGPTDGSPSPSGVPSS